MPHGQMTIKELLSTNQQYDASLYRQCLDLVDGGEPFEQNIDRYLVQRNCNVGQGPKPQMDLTLENPFPAGDWGGVRSWGDSEQQSKKKWFEFKPLAAGIFDRVASATANDPVRLWTSKPSPYWLEVEAKFRRLEKPLIRAMLQYGRPFLLIQVPKTPDEKESMASARQRGALDAMPALVLPQCILDWKYDPYDGDRLVWAKTHAETRERSADFGPEDMIRHTVTFYTDRECITYTWDYPLIGPEPDQNSLVDPIAVSHDLKICPLIPVCVPSDNGPLWAARRLLPAIRSHLNSCATKRWFTTIQGHPILIAPDPNNQPTQIPNRPDACILGQMEFISPSADGYAGLKESCDEDRSDFFAILNAITIEAISATQNARQSYKAKELDQEISGAEGFVEGFACYAKLGIALWCETVSRNLRSEPEAFVEVQGLTDLHKRTIEERTQTLLSVQGLKDFPQIPLRYEMQQLAYDIAPGLPKELRDAAEARFDVLAEPEEEETVDGTSESGTAGTAPAK